MRDRLHPLCAVLLVVAACKGEIGASRFVMPAAPAAPADDVVEPLDAGAVADAAVAGAADDDAIADGAADAMVAPAPPVPVLWLQVSREIGATAVPGTMRIVEAPDAGHAELTAAPSVPATPIALKLRGTYSATLPKKSYTLTTLDDAGVERELPLLGMPAGSDWALNACWADRTCMRNALAYELGAAMGRWSPRLRFVEVYLDGRYAGLYNLVEKIRVHPSRVAIPEPARSAAGDLTGGYIVRREGAGTTAAEDWRSKQGLMWTYQYPAADEVTAAQKAYLREHIDAFQDVMQGAAWADAAAGYPAWIDVPSWVDYAIAQELSRNWDGFVRSFYVVKQPRSSGGLLHAFPLWDFDLAFGNATLADSTRIDGWAHHKPTRVAPDDVPFFWVKLMADPSFQGRMRCRWQQLREGVLSPAALRERLAAWRHQLAAPRQRDDQRWSTSTMEIPPTPVVGATFDEHAAWLIDWVERRAGWLDANLPGRCP